MDRLSYKIIIIIWLLLPHTHTHYCKCHRIMSNDFLLLTAFKARHNNRGMQMILQRGYRSQNDCQHVFEMFIILLCYDLNNDGSV